MSDFDLDELDRLEAQATPAPWDWTALDPCDERNDNFLVAIRNSYPALSAEIRRLREQNERMREYIQHQTDCGDKMLRKAARRALEEAE